MTLSFGYCSPKLLGIYNSSDCQKVEMPPFQYLPRFWSKFHTFSLTLTLLLPCIEQSDCTYCLYGMYCDAEGLTWPAGDCDPGFYCLRGSLDPNNPTEDATGGPCPPGHYCPLGTSFPLGCDAGTYNPLEGQYECQDCEEGWVDSLRQNSLTFFKHCIPQYIFYRSNFL